MLTFHNLHLKKPVVRQQYLIFAYIVQYCLTSSFRTYNNQNPILIEEMKILGENNFPMVVDHPYADVDIDTQEDLDYAHFVLKNTSNE